MRKVLGLQNYLKYKEKNLFWIVVNDVTDCLCSLHWQGQEDTGIVKSLWSPDGSPGKKDKVIESGKGEEIYKSGLAKSISNLGVFHPLAVFHSGALKLL